MRPRVNPLAHGRIAPKRYGSLNKQHMKKTLIFILLISSFYAQSQNSYNNIKDLIINIENNDKQNTKSIMDNIKLFSEVGLDQIDIDLLLKGPLLGTLLIKISSDKQPTYQDLYNEFQKLKETEEYSKIHSSYEKTNKIENKSVNYRNWENDKQLLIDLNFSTTEIEQIRLLVEKNIDTSKTYKSLIFEFEANKKQVNSLKSESLFEFYNEINIDSLLVECKKHNKPIILYFTGYNCINCRKIEQFVLIEDKISKKLLNDFLFISIYTDNYTLLEKNKWYVSKVSKKNIKTIGEKNSDYQITKFGMNTLPLFICLNSENKIIGQADYLKDINKFEFFLNDCLKNYNK